MIATSVRTGNALAHFVRAALAMLQEQLTLRVLLALLADQRSCLQTLMTVVGYHGFHIAVAFVLYTLGILDDALVVAFTVFS